jgi:hypothetical protein
MIEYVPFHPISFLANSIKYCQSLLLFEANCRRGSFIFEGYTNICNPQFSGESDYTGNHAQ